MSEPIRRPVSEEKKPSPKRRRGVAKKRSVKRSGVDTVNMTEGAKAPSRSRRRRRRWTFRSWLTLIGVGLIFLIVGGGIAGYIFVRRYLLSDKFHAQVSEQTGAALRAETSVFAPFEWENLTMKTDNYKAEGGSDAFFEEIELRTVSTEISMDGVRRGVWLIPSVRADWMKIDFIHNPETAAEHASDTTAGINEGMSVEAESNNKVRWPMTLLPDKAELETMDIRSANLRFPLGENREARALGMGMQGERLPDESGYRFNLSSGQISILPFFGAGEDEGALAIDRAVIELRDGNLFVNEAELRGVGNNARVRVEGYLVKSTVIEGAREMRFETKIEQLPIAELLGAKWANRLVGSFNGEILTERGATQSEVTTTGKVWLNKARLDTPTVEDDTPVGIIDGVSRLATDSGFTDMFGGMMPMLGAYTESKERFRSILFDEARLRFAQRADRIELREIYFYSSGLMAIEGDMNISEGQLNGLLQVGVAPSVLAGVPGAESVVFTESRAGMRWTPVKISGTLDDPQEDLSARLVRAAGERILEIVPDTGKAVIKGTQRVIEGGVPMLRDTADSALRGGAGIIEEGGSTLFNFLNGGDKNEEDVPKVEQDEPADDEDKPEKDDAEPEPRGRGLIPEILR